jgi:hypothetical protein
MKAGGGKVKVARKLIMCKRRSNTINWALEELSSHEEAHKVFSGHDPHYGDGGSSSSSSSSSQSVSYASVEATSIKVPPLIPSVHIS